MRQYTDAILWYDRAISIDPDYDISRIFKARTYLLSSGQGHESIAILNRLHREPLPLIELISVYKIERNYKMALHF